MTWTVPWSRGRTLFLRYGRIVDEGFYAMLGAWTLPAWEVADAMPVPVRTVSVLDMPESLKRVLDAR